MTLHLIRPAGLWTFQVLVFEVFQEIYKGAICNRLKTSFCVNWAFLIARGTRLKHKRSEGFKASRAIKKAQFTQKRVAYKMLLFETTSLKLSNFSKMVSHLLLTVLTNFSKPVRSVTLNVLSRATVRLGQLRGSLQRRKMRS
jgi:hypothetical protein